MFFAAWCYYLLIAYAFEFVLYGTLCQGNSFLFYASLKEDYDQSRDGFTRNGMFMAAGFGPTHNRDYIPGQNGLDVLTMR